jgi:predicted dehydrogenase
MSGYPGRRLLSPRIALIGLGCWGRQYVRIATTLGATVVVCHTRHEGGDARWLADGYPAVKHTTSLDAALDDELDGVAIVTPRRSHALLTRECLRRGRHVLVEKPAATSMEDLEWTHAEARARRLVLRTGYTHLFDESIRELARLARRATAPRWRLTWTKPAPETGVTELIWEYYPHVFSIAGLLGDVDAAQLGTARFRAVRGTSGAATVEVDLPMRNGTGHVTVSSDADVRHKSIRLYDGDEPIAEWSDRRLLDVRRNRVFEAYEEPLLCQVRSFFHAITSPGGEGHYALDRTVTSLLVELSMEAQRAGFSESVEKREETEVGT